VVTKHGIACHCAVTIAQQAWTLIGVAAPEFREELEDAKPATPTGAWPAQTHL